MRILQANYLRISYYAQYVLGILPCTIGVASQMPELFDYIFNRDDTKTPTFKGSFPMVSNFGAARANVRKAL